MEQSVILVTGAGRGLGRGIARHLAGAGFSVAINYRQNRSAAEAAVGECKALKIDAAQRFIPIQADISRTADRNRLVETCVRELGRLDALVNNAGIAPPERADIVEASEESFQQLIDTNLQGPYFLTQRVVRYWLGLSESPPPAPRLGSGFKILFVTSVSSEMASVNRGEYCISKAGLSMAAHLWAVRLAKHEIQVFELRPGIMKTDMTRVVQDKYDRLIADGLVPQQRWGTADDVGTAVVALIMGQLPFATGSVIHLDGGLHLGQF